MSRSLFIAFFIAVALGLAATLQPWRNWLSLKPATPTPDSVANVAGAISEVFQAPGKRSDGAPQGNAGIDELVQDISKTLRQTHAFQAHSIAFQVSLKALRDDLLKEFPAQGLSIFKRILAQAFPDYLQEILQAIALMDKYDHWLIENTLELNNMNALAYRGSIWSKRRELFGDDAELIWSTELNEAEERIESMHKTVALLNQGSNASNQEKLLLLKDSFEKAFSGTAQGAMLDAKSVLAQVFFGFDSVQQELAGAPPEARQEKINALRQSLGFDEKSIRSMAAADQQRESRWQTGYAYMEEREQLTSTLQGAAQAQALDQLRIKHFGEEARTIKLEEEDLGLFRYERPRVYGRN